MSQQKLDNQLIEKTIEQRLKILNDAKAKAESILENAEEERKKILEQYNNALQTVIGSELRAVHDRIVGRAHLEGRKRMLEARHEALNRVKDAAFDELNLIASRKHPDYDYDGILIDLLLEAIDMIYDDPYIVSANKQDLAFLEENLGKIVKASGGKKIQLKDNPIDILGGVYVSNIDGKKTMENTLEVRLETAHERLQTQIAKELEVI
jgi:vacuolar-type H+-ATPase subunit E/Vma4